jgi:hypothetical protein
MFKALSLKGIKTNNMFLNKNKIFNTSFSRKINPSSNKENLPEIKEENYLEKISKFENIKILQGKYPYMPLDDHPLIPGYARMIAISREISDKLKELKAESTKLVVSVCKNPEKIEGVQQVST